MHGDLQSWLFFPLSPVQVANIAAFVRRRLGIDTRASGVQEPPQLDEPVTFGDDFTTESLVEDLIERLRSADLEVLGKYSEAMDVVDAQIERGFANFGSIIRTFNDTQVSLNICYLFKQGSGCRHQSLGLGFTSARTKQMVIPDSSVLKVRPEVEPGSAPAFDRSIVEWGLEFAIHEDYGARPYERTFPYGCFLPIPLVSASIDDADIPDLAYEDVVLDVENSLRCSSNIELFARGDWRVDMINITMRDLFTFLVYEPDFWYAKENIVITGFIVRISPGDDADLHLTKDELSNQILFTSFTDSAVFLEVVSLSDDGIFEKMVMFNLVEMGQIDFAIPARVVIDISIGQFNEYPYAFTTWHGSESKHTVVESPDETILKSLFLVRNNFFSEDRLIHVVGFTYTYSNLLDEAGF